MRPVVPLRQTANKTAAGKNKTAAGKNKRANKKKKATDLLSGLCACKSLRMARELVAAADKLKARLKALPHAAVEYLQSPGSKGPVRQLTALPEHSSMGDVKVKGADSTVYNVAKAALDQMNRAAHITSRYSCYYPVDPSNPAKYSPVQTKETKYVEVNDEVRVRGGPDVISRVGKVTKINLKGQLDKVTRYTFVEVLFEAYRGEEAVKHKVLDGNLVKNGVEQGC